MAYEAKVIEIIIASPTDVAEERGIVREVIAEWNAVYAADRSAVLLPIGWETHSSPELAGRPQQIINDRLLPRADLLVGIFWTRVGSPTGKAISGSIEEIQEHHRRGKPVMLYFSNVPVVPASVDQAQYAQLTAFREWARNAGLVESFESRDDFRGKFTRQLALTLRDNPYLKRLLIREIASAQSAPRPGAPSLSPISAEASELVREAASSQNDQIIIMRGLGGAIIQAGEKSFGQPNDRRSVARYEAAAKELSSRGLISDVNGKGEVFQVTDAGYRFIDRGN